MSDLHCVLAFLRNKKEKNPNILLPFVTLPSRSFLYVGKVKFPSIPSAQLLLYLLQNLLMCISPLLIPWERVTGTLFIFIHQCVALALQLQLFGLTRIIWGWSCNRSPWFHLFSFHSADLWPVCWCLESNLLLSPAKLKDTRCDLPF